MSETTEDLTRDDGFDLTRDDVFDLLSNARRRYVIHYLAGSGGRENLTELAEEVAAWEMGVPVDAVTDDARRRVYISLYQTHLPKLEQSGIVTYDQESRIVELTVRADDLVTYLPSPRLGRPWPVYYLVVAIVGIVASALVWLEVVSVAGGLVGGGLGVVVLLLAVGHYLSERRGGHTAVLEALVE